MTKAQAAGPFADILVVFDLDGTLVDSAPDLTAALNHVLTQEGLPPADPKVVRHLVGHGARALCERGFELAGEHWPEGERAEALLKTFLDYYEAHMSDHSFVFDGVEECLTTLKNAGATLSVCTNKRHYLAAPLLTKFGISGFFRDIYGRDSAAEHKPSPLPLIELQERSGCARAVMIGDTMTDLGAARAASWPSGFATFGYGEEGIELAPNEQAFDHYSELYSVLQNIFARHK